MTRLPEGKTRLDLVKEGLADVGIKKRGRLIVSISKLKEDPHNERKTFRNMEGLIASIKAVGLIEPITVTQDGDDSYQIITGHRRYRAAKSAGLELVEVLIREPEDARSRRRKSIISNVQREDVGPVEMAEALQAMIDEDERIASQDDLAKIIGKNKTWVSGMLGILKLSVNLQQRVASTTETVSYDSMIRIARLPEPEQQELLIDMLLGGATQSEIRSRIDEFKTTPGSSAKASAAGGKPKRVFSTKYQATVIVQSTTKQLSNDQVIDALQEALGRALNGSPTAHAGEE